MAVSTENFIDAIQNEHQIWDSNLNASEEEKELAWKRVGEKIETPNGKKLSFRPFVLS